MCRLLPGVWFAVTPELRATCQRSRWCLPEADGRPGTGSELSRWPRTQPGSCHLLGRQQRGRWPMPVTLVCSGSVPWPGCGHSLLKTEQRGDSCHAEAQATHDCQKSYPRSCSEHGPKFLAAAGSVRVRLRGWVAGSSQKPIWEPACRGLPRCRVLQLGPQPWAANPVATHQ